MATTYPRTIITRTPDVERIVDVGRGRWPGMSPGAILVELAKERSVQLADPDADPMAQLLVFPGSGNPITNEMVAEALANGY